MKLVIPHFTKQDITNLKMVADTFETLKKVISNKKHLSTFEKFNEFGKYPKNSSFKTVQYGALTVYQGLRLGGDIDATTGRGHSKIVDGLLKAKLLVSASDTELQLNIEYFKVIGRVLNDPKHEQIVKTASKSKGPILKTLRASDRVYSDE